MLRFVLESAPHFIALAASSPYVQGIDTDFQSARLNYIDSFPLSGHAPFFLTWEEVEIYFEKMSCTGIVDSFKDCYWDIRLSPVYGTIEVRVMDTPLSIERAASIAGYIQTLARYLLIDKPFVPQEDDYFVYAANRFMACRFGLEGVCINAQTHRKRTIAEDIAETLEKLAPHAQALDSQSALASIQQQLRDKTSDADRLRRLKHAYGSLNEVVRQQCLIWRGWGGSTGYMI